jgi:hypothetical protein
VLKRHSTLFGFLFSTLLSALTALVTGWSLWIIIPFVIGMMVLPRLLYGWSASKSLDKISIDEPVWKTIPDGTLTTRVSRAYLDAQGGYDSSGHEVSMYDVKEAAEDE